MTQDNRPVNLDFDLPAQPFAGDNFGMSVAISGELLAVGANRDANSGSGLNPTTSARDASGSGGVHVFQ